MKTPLLRLKRLRQTPAIRDMLRETYLHPSQLIAPIFVSEIHDAPQEIKTMPGVFQLPLDALEQEVETIAA